MLKKKRKPKPELKWWENGVMLDACDEALEWVKRYSTPQAAWNACTDPVWLLWLIVAVARDSMAAKIVGYLVDNEGLSSPPLIDQLEVPVERAIHYIVPICPLVRRPR